MTRHGRRGLRTRYCGTLTAADVGEDVALCGWVGAASEHGEHLAFIDLRDHTGVVQCVVDGGQDLRSEHVVRICGTVRLRPEDKVNPALATGEIEVGAESVELWPPPRRRRSHSMLVPRPTSPCACDIATSTFAPIGCSATSVSGRR